MIKIGIVVQRYGKDVVGGAETLAKDVAERLNSNGFDVTVFTTTAKDYISWKNYYNEGESILNGVLIKRYNSEKERDIEEFNKYSNDFFNPDSKNRNENEWIELQGPYCPKLIDAIDRVQNKFDVFIFFTYLYYTTIEGLKVIRKPKVLFPTAHDELPIYLNLMRDVFLMPDSLFFLTEAEMNLVKRLFNPESNLALIRTGIDIKDKIDPLLIKNNFPLILPFMLYAGRIEKGKGLELVFNAFQELRKRVLLDFVLIGKRLMDIPDIEGIKYLGFVSEEEKLSAFNKSYFSIQPSPVESLSITTLESFTQRTPVLVNSASDVLLEHIRYSEGGFSYKNENEFIDNAIKLYNSKKLRIEMGNKGYDYIKKYFTWEVVVDKLKKEIKKII